MVASLGMDFAVSYLCGGVLSGTVLRPWSETGRRKLASTGAALDVLRGLGITLGVAVPLEHRQRIDAVDDILKAQKSKAKW